MFSLDASCVERMSLRHGLWQVDWRGVSEVTDRLRNAERHVDWAIPDRVRYVPRTEHLEAQPDDVSFFL